MFIMLINNRYDNINNIIHILSVRYFFIINFYLLLILKVIKLPSLIKLTYIFVI